MSVGMKTMRVGLGFPTLMVFILYCIDLTSFFHNFASRSPILMIFTFLKMALKFICSSSWVGGRGIKIEAIYARNSPTDPLFYWSRPLCTAIEPSSTSLKVQKLQKKAVTSVKNRNSFSSSMYCLTLIRKLWATKIWIHTKYYSFRVKIAEVRVEKLNITAKSCNFSKNL